MSLLARPGARLERGRAVTGLAVAGLTFTTLAGCAAFGQPVAPTPSVTVTITTTASMAAPSDQQGSAPAPPQGTGQALAAGGVPRDAAPFVGTWVGPVQQTGSGPYTVSLTLDWVDGKLVGTSVYPELGQCRGDLINPRIFDGVLTVDEVITQGSRCVDIAIRLEPSGQTLLYSWPQDPSLGGATLTRSQ